MVSVTDRKYPKKNRYQILKSSRENDLSKFNQQLKIINKLNNEKLTFKTRSKLVELVFMGRSQSNLMILLESMLCAKQFQTNYKSQLV